MVCQGFYLKSRLETVWTRSGHLGWDATLSLDQMDLQVVAGGHKLNLRRDLRWMAKCTRKFPHKYMQVPKNPFQSRHILNFIG